MPEEDEKKATPQAVAEELLTREIVGSGEAYRKLGEIFVSVLAAIPGAALITGLIKAPAEGGLDELHLALGLGAAMLAVGLGALLAFRVRAPVEIGQAELRAVDLGTIVGTTQESYDRLSDRIDQVEAEISNLPDDTTDDVRKARWAEFDSLVATLRQVQLVATSREVRKRIDHDDTRALAFFALVAAGVATFFLAIAPVENTEVTAVTAVTVELATDAEDETALTPAAEALGCSTPTFAALKIGGTDEAPEVLPLGDVTCEAGTILKLATDGDKKSASVEEIDASSEMPDESD
jgi:hypothetical protein